MKARSLASKGFKIAYLANRAAHEFADKGDRESAAAFYDIKHETLAELKQISPEDITILEEPSSSDLVIKFYDGRRMHYPKRKAHLLGPLPLGRPAREESNV